VLICAVLAACSGGSVDPELAGEPSATSASTTATTAAPATKGPVTFAFAGDVHFVDHIEEQLLADPRHVLDPVKPVLSSADLAMVNLETAITDRGAPVAGKNFHFRSPAKSFDALEAAGVDVVSMANNHVLDYGPDGMADTFAAIAKTKLPVIGLGHDAAEAYEPYRTTINGQRIGIVSALDWLEPGLIDAWSATETQAGVAFSIDPTRLLAEVEALRPDVDTLIAFLHWGTEETHCASPEQSQLAQQLIDAGADLVVGSHAHRVFGAGHVGDALVAYGLGNFVYWNEEGESGRSGILQVQVTGRHVDSYSWVPARITNGIPIPETGDAAAADEAEWEARRTCSGLAP
jgi:poly-gamma-glutamate synthesis protein (capsule biosynthesis protein)